jgi:hypothetical protein
VIQNLKKIKKNLTSTPKLETFKVKLGNDLMRDNNNNTINVQTTEKKGLFNSELSPLIFQKRKTAFEQNRNQLSQFVLRKNFELSNKKVKENMPKATEMPGNLKAKTRDLLKNLCMNFEPSSPIEIKDTINETSQNDDVFELTNHDSSRLNLLDKLCEKNATIVIDSLETTNSKPKLSIDKSLIVIKSTNYSNENKENCNGAPKNDFFTSIPSSLSKINALTSADQSVIVMKKGEHEISNMKNNFLDDGSFIDYDYSLVVPDTQVVQKIIPDTQTQVIILYIKCICH